MMRTVGKIAGECGVEYCLEVLNRFDGVSAQYLCGSKEIRGRSGCAGSEDHAGYVPYEYRGG